MKHPKIPIYITRLKHVIPKDYLYYMLVEQHKKHSYIDRGNNFLAEDTEYAHLDKLYNAFLMKASEVLGPLDLLPNNSKSCWAYVTNCDEYRGGIHHHMKTSVINAVYYLNMPDTTDLKDGSISFYDDSEEELFWYKPRNGDLIMFPNYLKHEPNRISTKEYRVAINMEIMCENIW